MTFQADQQPFDENRQVITRNDLFKILNRLETRVTTLQKLIESRIDEQQDGKGGQPFIKCFRSIMANFYFNAIFRTHIFLFTILQMMFNMGIILVLESVYMHFWQLQIVIGIMIAFTGFFLITTLLVSIEQIMQLIKRQAQLMTMIRLYMSTTFLFGMLYTEIELIQPGSFSGVSYKDYNLVLRPLQLLLDLLYFSNIAQASVGFGDISPQTSYTRFIALVQALFSVAFLTILFSNWVS